MGPPVILIILSVLSVTLTQVTADCSNLGNCYNLGELELEVDIDDDTISLQWKVNSTEFIYGYKIIIKEPDETYIYESPVLNRNAESMEVKQALDGVEASVCLLILINETEAIAEKCEEVKTSDMQMIVGILAGVVFLVPCITALSFVIYKDWQIMKTSAHNTSEKTILIEQVLDVEAIDDRNEQISGKVNKCFEGDMDTMTSEGETKAVKTEACVRDESADTCIIKKRDYEKAKPDSKKERDNETADHNVVKGKDVSLAILDKVSADKQTVNVIVERSKAGDHTSGDPSVFTIKL